ncbi:MAG: hypothetical protein IJ692_01730 [Alloprevotella sp.]|nr:hypothetical protein [Alloprevotella sp.]MBR1652092.1 hypothetical protein [Alloprevotella sp.]
MKKRRYLSKLALVALLAFPLQNLCAQHRRNALILVPSSVILQNAGNMGTVSLGAGWQYGRDHWETQVLGGFIPKHDSTRPKFTMTFKENFVPWNLQAGKRWEIQPLTATMYVNAVFGHEFWAHQPNRYPNKYYDYLSTKYRVNVGLGQRVTLRFSEHVSKRVQSASLFYEVSTCDLYIRAATMNRDVKLGHILGLSLGVKARLR